MHSPAHCSSYATLPGWNSQLVDTADTAGPNMNARPESPWLQKNMEQYSVSQYTKDRFLCIAEQGLRQSEDMIHMPPLLSLF